MEEVPEIIHPFWGKISDSRGRGYTSAITFSHPFFRRDAYPVYLGHHDITYTPLYIQQNPGQVYKPPESILGENYCLLDEFADTYSDFINNIEERVATLQHGFYEYFREHLFPRLPVIFEEYPDIQTAAAHNEYIRDLADIRLEKGGRLKLLFYYDLFPAPVFSVDFINGMLSF